MIARICVALRHLGAGFSRRCDGSVAPIFGLVMIPILGMVGAAVDYSRAGNARAGLQSALDTAVLAGAKDGTAGWADVALNVFNANVASKGATQISPSFTTDGQGTFSGSLTATVPTVVLGIMQIPEIKIGGASSAIAGETDNSCILTLDAGKPPSNVSLVLNGAPNVTLSGCALRSNTSMSCNGHSGNASASIAAGATSGCSKPQSSATVVPDIHAALAKNITRICGGSTAGATWYVGSAVPAGAIKISQSGYTEYHVCGNLTLSGEGTLTGNAPSSDTVIVIENGSLNIDDRSAISAWRVTIVFTGNNSVASSIDFPTGAGQAASLSLSPSKSVDNPWQGVSVYQDPTLTKSTSVSWGPGATFNADGLVYLPNSDVTLSGIAGSSSAQCTKLVTKTFTTNGAPALKFSQTSGGCATIGLTQWSGPLRLTQ